ncbi:FAD-dependent oxidoreductase [Pseudonocardia parietis]|uniref:NADH dehydrogenase FAD-containing subunit n=1 Tax=Pseudonocardia parietis TaxID=570936 RepID=A0ABS4VMX9_9PSEU|nr:FAD-dependent oxidoreductase [Pseudonocardia parietis]MBP2365260.1 NADH dehydrogenase FAD-containing subunit [Pseudonocardia parietis]
MTTTVLVIGAGYAGVTAANRIAAARAGEVTVLDPRDEFVERIRLHRLAAGSGAATVPLRRVLDPRVRTRRARVTAIGDGAVTLDGGDLLRFDRLVYAVGSGGGPAPGDGHRVDTLEGATRLHDAVAALPDGRAVTVVGGLIVGAGDAVVQLVDSRDRPRRLTVGGRAGALVKEQVCRYTLRAVRGRAA